MNIIIMGVKVWIKGVQISEGLLYFNTRIHCWLTGFIHTCIDVGYSLWCPPAFRCYVPLLRVSSELSLSFSSPCEGPFYRAVPINDLDPTQQSEW